MVILRLSINKTFTVGSLVLEIRKSNFLFKFGKMNFSVVIASTSLTLYSKIWVAACILIIGTTNVPLPRFQQNVIAVREMSYDKVNSNKRGTAEDNIMVLRQ